MNGAIAFWKLVLDYAHCNIIRNSCTVFNTPGSTELSPLFGACATNVVSGERVHLWAEIIERLEVAWYPALDIWIIWIIVSILHHEHSTCEQPLISCGTKMIYNNKNPKTETLVEFVRLGLFLTLYQGNSTVICRKMKHIFYYQY